MPSEASIRGLAVKARSHPRAWKRALLVGFITQLFLIVFVTAIGLHQLGATTESLNEVVDLHMQKQDLTKAMVISARERSMILVLLSRVDDPFKRDELFLDFSRNGSAFIAARQALGKLPLDSRERELLQLQRQLTDVAQPLQLQAIDLINSNLMQEAALLTLRQAIPAQDMVMSVLRQLDEATHSAALRASNQARRDHEVARFWMYLLSAAALAVGLVVALVVFSITTRVTRERETLATHDTLTGLPNRLLFLDRLEQALVRAERYRTLVGLMFIDLDQFKRVNDTLGHGCGDQLIRQVAARLRKTVRSGDVVARLGGDEFVVVVGEIVEVKQVLKVVEKMLATVAAPYQLDERELFSSCSIGISVYPQDGTCSSDLLKHADTAMYHAKNSGRNRFQLYDPAMNALAEERLQLETDLHYALERNEFAFHYQPQINVETGQIHAVEALLRWNHPAQGVLTPDAFLDLLEETGQIVVVGRTLLERACRQTVRWQTTGNPELALAVNLSSREFWNEGLIAGIQGALTRTRLPPHTLQIELTERIFMEDMDAAVKRVRSLKALGVSVSVDDFGTGYSSLAHLKRFPLDVLKIDRYFVRDIERDSVDAALVSSIIALSRNLGLENVAEGIENQAQLDCLRQLGCAVMQGYHICRPVPPRQLSAFFSSDWLHAFNATQAAQLKLTAV